MYRRRFVGNKGFVWVPIDKEPEPLGSEIDKLLASHMIVRCTHSLW